LSARRGRPEPLAAAGAVLVVATAAFATQPASRAWRPAPAQGPRGGSLRTPAMRTLVAVLVMVGVVFGAVEIAVAAAARDLGGGAAAGPLLGIWGAGSLAGGLIAVRAGGGARTGAGLALVLAALAAGHLALAAAAGNVFALAAVLAVAGATIAPTYAGVFSMVERAAPQGTATEAFAWLNTAVAIGAAAGSAAAGAVADAAGPAAAFVLAGAVGAAAALTAALRSHTLDEPAERTSIEAAPAAA
jgi:predicted MFS family arabinose efflux permease